MSVPGIDAPGRDFESMIGIKSKAVKEQETEETITQNNTESSMNDSNSLYLEIINSKIIKSSSSLKEKVNSFYKNNYNSLTW